MSGQCYGCGDAFGFFKKEHGCKNCGFAFCSNCLNKKTNIPKLNNEKHKVCLKCYNIITKNIKEPQQAFEAPDAYYKRLAALEDGSSTKKKIHSSGQEPKPSAKKHKYLSKEDQSIAERLEKLKEARRKEAKPIPTHKEMEERLAKLKESRPEPPTEEAMRQRLSHLKGQSTSTAQAKHVFETEKRSEQEQIDELMKQYFEEVRIDQKSNPTDETDGTQNDLNMNTENFEKTITEKNIQSDDKDLDEVIQLIQKTAKEKGADAAKALTNLTEDKELMDKLKVLKKQRDSDKKQDPEREEQFNKENSESENENEDEMAQNVIKQILQDSKREEEEELAGLTGQIEKLPNPPASGQLPSGSTFKDIQDKTSVYNKYGDDDDEELPWCCICNNDASLRCLGCDGDLYCNRCFREGHPDFELEDHRSVPFRPKRKV